MNLEKYLIANEGYQPNPIKDFENYMDRCFENYLNALDEEYWNLTAMESEGSASSDTGKVDSIFQRIKNSTSKFRSAKSSNDENKAVEAEKELKSELSDLKEESKKSMTPEKAKKIRIAVGALMTATGIAAMGWGVHQINKVNKDFDKQNQEFQDQMKRDTKMLMDSVRDMANKNAATRAAAYGVSKEIDELTSVTNKL